MNVVTSCHPTLRGIINNLELFKDTNLVFMFRELELAQIINIFCGPYEITIRIGDVNKSAYIDRYKIYKGSKSSRKQIVMKFENILELLDSSNIAELRKKLDALDF